jgi:hypothetical protein
MSAAGIGFLESETQTETVAHARVGLRADVAIAPWFALRAAAGVAIPLVRPQFYVADAGARRQVYQPAPIAGVGGADLFFSF